ncbi:MAG: ABC transporter ATP-binding protein [Candidatus Eisenbacteria bacterium]|uniref:ABC transporter ATP-binding protein n=1 Tax=Eiseniibacteriota bacterium TaxID=2212470 RepID=A0A956LYS9_UNCEI|nr:ABC transporter ATP-binding protein [Candidatus Eisenbacteria bacterium]
MSTDGTPRDGTTTPVLEILHVTKSFPSASRRLVALHDVSLRVDPGRAIAILGRSGSGKSTLLHLAAGIEVPTGGRVVVLGRDLAALGETERTLLRRREIGLVFQFFHLLPQLSILDNVCLPDWIAGDGGSATEGRARELLERVGLEDRAADRVESLSGGEQQRVAICRALLRRPHLLLADEPTGNLDDDNAAIVMDLLVRLARAEGSSLLYATHSTEFAARADTRYRLHGGVLEPGVP